MIKLMCWLWFRCPCADCLARIESLLLQLLQGEKEIMAAIDDLNTALTGASATLTQLSTDQTALVTALQALEGQQAPDLAPAIAAATAISTGLTNIDTQVKTALAGIPQPPAPPAP